MDKVYLKSSFGYREDTKENWEAQNPVLERGEPAIVRDGIAGRWLKIGDGVTPFGALPWKIGPKGEQGIKGDKGETGPQGEKGPQGAKGDKGDKGDTGATGATGAQGPQGETGATGEAGKDGISITKAEINASGELVLTFSNNTSVNLGVIKGDKGDKGDTGATGAQGPQGETGATGEAGKSAYELYKEKYNYEGTEEEWISDLINGNLISKPVFTVTFNPNNGDTTFTQTIEKGELATRPTVPTKLGYTFGGWTIEGHPEEVWVFDSNTVMKDVTLTPKWSVITYEVQYYLNGSTNNDNNPLTFTVEDLPLTLGTPTKANSDFDGWYTDNLFENSITEITELANVKLYAKWFDPTPGLVYEFVDNGYQIKGYTGADKDVCILKEYNGYPVTSILSSAFADNTIVETVTILAELNNIGEKAFLNCTNLKSIIVPSSVTSIGKGAFQGCNSLTSITLPFVGASRTAEYYEATFGYIFGYYTQDVDDGKSSTSEVSETKSFAFVNSNYASTSSNVVWQYSCYSAGVGNTGYYKLTGYYYYIPASLETVVITDATIIPTAAFNGCSNITSITLNEGVTSIKGYAFQDCSSLENIVVPNSVTSIEGYVFQNCSSLENVVLSNGLTRIASDIFKNCISLREIAIPNSVTSIGSFAFSGCSSLEEIVIPSTVTSIETYAFNGCSSLATVYYCGTAMPTINATGNTSLTNAAQYLYSASEPTTEGNFWHYDENGEITVWPAYVAPAKSVTYSFESNGGSAVDSVTSVSLDALPETTKSGYTFLGWYESSDFSGEPIVAPYTSDSDVTLYAKWISNTFARAEIASVGTNGASISSAGQRVYFKFVAPTTKSYTIKSLTDTGYARGALYNSNGALLSEGSAYFDFTITYNMTAGETYYIAVYFHSSSSTGNIPFSIS